MLDKVGETMLSNHRLPDVLVEAAGSWMIVITRGVIWTLIKAQTTGGPPGSGLN